MKYLDLIELLEDSYDNSHGELRDEILDNVMSQIKTKNELYNVLSECGIKHNDNDERSELKKILRDHFIEHFNALQNISSPSNF